MTPRSIRRAAERKALKLARKAAARAESEPSSESFQSPAPNPEPTKTSFPITRAKDEAAVFSEPKNQNDEAALFSEPKNPRRLLANRANPQDEAAILSEPKNQNDEAAILSEPKIKARSSTGPTSAAGKARSSMNALKTALTGRTVLLPTDDAAAYERVLLAYEKDLRPVGQQECDLVQSIVDSTWRLSRIPTLELAIYAKGRLEFANSFDDRSPAERPGLIELETFLAYEKQLRNLQLQEARLSRRREKELAELRRLQQLREQQEKVQLDVAAKLYLSAQHDRKPFDPADHGFEFSIHDVERYLGGVRAANIAQAILKEERAGAFTRLKAHSQAA